MSEVTLESGRIRALSTACVFRRVIGGASMRRKSMETDLLWFFILPQLKKIGKIFHHTDFVSYSLKMLVYGRIAINKYNVPNRDCTLLLTHKKVSITNCQILSQFFWESSIHFLVPHASSKRDILLPPSVSIQPNSLICSQD